MPIGPTSGFLDFTNATPRANVIIALSNVGVGTDVPLHALDIRGTANVADIIINNDLTLTGGLTTNTLTINNVSMSTTSNFQQVTNVANATTNTVRFTNPTTGFTVSSNAEVGGELSVSGNTALSSNLFVTGNVGIGTTEPTESLDIVGNLNLQKVSNTATIKLNSNVVTEFARSKKFMKFPRVVMTAASGESSGYQGYYVTESSNSADTNRHSWKAFEGTTDNSTSENAWAPDQTTTTYSGTDYSYNGSFNLGTGAVNGEWIKLQLPHKIKLEYMKIWLKNNDPTRIPEDWRLYGSNDNTNWTELFSKTGQASINENTYFINTSSMYQYLAVVVTKISGQNNYFRIVELEYYGVPEYDPEAHGTDVIMRSVPNVPNTDWLEVYWDAGNTSSYSGSGSTTVTDLSGNGVTGTITGTNGFDSTYNAWEFDGSGDYIQGATSIGTGQVIHTWSLWVKNLTPTSTQYAYMCGFGTASSANMSGFMLRDGDRLEFTALGTYVYAYEDFPNAENTWKHVVGVYRGNAWNSANCDVYIDGRKVDVRGTSTTTLNISGTAVNIGSRPGGGQPFVGSIANARIFSRALTSDEVWQLYSYQREYFGHGNLDMTLKGGVLDVQGGIKVNNYPFSSAACLQVSTSQNQSLNQSNYQTVTFNNIDVDTINGWDATNNRYQPQVPGFYIVNAQRFNIQATSSYVVCLIRKNEVDVCSETIVGSGLNHPMGGATALVYLNGTTDYVYVLGLASTTINLTTNRSLHIIHVSF